MGGYDNGVASLNHTNNFLPKSSPIAKNPAYRYTGVAIRRIFGDRATYRQEIVSVF